MACCKVPQLAMLPFTPEGDGPSLSCHYLKKNKKKSMHMPSLSLSKAPY
jgi:hypothetical protein